MKSLQYYWYHSNFLVWLLLPLSWLYCSVTIVRRKLYQLDIKKSYGSKKPVVIIGNIVVGGSGKTPLLMALCEYIKASGYNPGVVSRGYGGNVSGVHQVSESDSAEMVGDEPLMICRRTMVPVVIGADRVSAVDYLVKNNRCDIVFSDDGLQHYRMKRDYEIAVIDSNRKFGNGFCLPAGPLRERKSRLNDVDMLVYNDTDSAASDGCSYALQIVSLNQLNNSDNCSSITSFLKKPVHAVAGIGDPARFFKQLQKNGIETIDHAFPDHHVYQQQDFSGWEKECIIMTEKDAVKCRHLVLPDAWVVIVKAVFSDVLETRLSSELLPLLDR